MAGARLELKSRRRGFVWSRAALVALPVVAAGAAILLQHDAHGRGDYVAALMPTLGWSLIAAPAWIALSVANRAMFLDGHGLLTEDDLFRYARGMAALVHVLATLAFLLLWMAVETESGRSGAALIGFALLPVVLYSALTLFVLSLPLAMMGVAAFRMLTLRPAPGDNSPV